MSSAPTPRYHIVSSPLREAVVSSRDTRGAERSGAEGVTTSASTIPVMTSFYPRVVASMFYEPREVPHCGSQVRTHGRRGRRLF